MKRTAPLLLFLATALAQGQDLSAKHCFVYIVEPNTPFIDFSELPFTHASGESLVRRLRADASTERAVKRRNFFTTLSWAKLNLIAQKLGVDPVDAMDPILAEANAILKMSDDSPYKKLFRERFTHAKERRNQSATEQRIFRASPQRHLDFDGLCQENFGVASTADALEAAIDWIYEMSFLNPSIPQTHRPEDLLARMKLSFSIEDQEKGRIDLQSKFSEHAVEKLNAIARLLGARKSRAMGPLMVEAISLLKLPDENERKKQFKALFHKVEEDRGEEDFNRTGLSVPKPIFMELKELSMKEFHIDATPACMEAAILWIYSKLGLE